MLFLTLGNIVLFGMQWLYETIRQRRYGQVMNRLLRTSSIIIQRTRKTDLRGTTLLHSTAQLSENLELEDDFIRISTLVPLQEVDLSTWTSYTSYLEIHTRAATPEQNICLLMEAKRPKDLDKFVNKALKIPPAYRVHVLMHGCPIAWKTADPFGIILHCSLRGLLILTDAFGQGRLTLEEDLELVRLVSVKTKGTPQKLVPQFNDQLSNTAEENSIGSKLDLINNDKETADPDTHLGIASTDIISKNSVQASSPLHQDRNFMDTEEETSFIVDDGNTNHSKGLWESSQVQGSTLSPVLVCDNGSTTESMRPRHPTKPPNILVYCGLKDTGRIFSGIRSTLEAVINTDSYTIYHLGHELMMSAPWSSNAALLVVSSCPQLRPEVEDKIMDYVVRYGGRLLSSNSSIDAKFAQKSPEEGIDGDRLVSFKYGDCDSVMTIRSRYYYRAMTEYSEVIIPRDNGAGDTCENGYDVMDKHRKALVLKTFGEGTGVAVLSQLLLERDPAEYATDPSSFAALKRSNTDRLTVFREILTSLGIDTSPGVIPPLTPCLLLVRRVGLKETFLDSFKHRLKEDRVLKSQNISLKFVDSVDNAETKPGVLPGVLPVVTSLDCDIVTQFFQLSQYWQNLKTSKLGQVVFYTDVITTTMTVFEGLLFSIPKDIGPIAIAGRQTSGKGRGDNSWLSPQGCAMFTLPVCLSIDSELGQRVSFLQHMVSVAVVKSVVTLPGYEDLDLKLKWPNDIYYGKEMKLGGVLVTSTVMGSDIYATIGCGFNVANSNPTICINDIIRLYNTSHPDLADLSPLSPSQLIARTVTILEGLMQDFDKNGHEAFCQEYYKHWLHEGAKVTIQLYDKPTHGEIAGLDEHGFLSVRTPDQGLLSVQPDGNSFDMMHNLIYVKSRS